MKDLNILTCTGCKAKLKLPSKFGPGRNFNCPKCSTILTVPSVIVPQSSSNKSGNYLTCTGCKAKLKLPTNFGSGKSLNCPICSIVLTVPSVEVPPSGSSESEINLICTGCKAKLKLPSNFGPGKSFNCPKCFIILKSPSQHLPDCNSFVSEKNLCIVCKNSCKRPEFAPYWDTCLECLKDECIFIDDCQSKEDIKSGLEPMNLFCHLYEDIVSQIGAINYDHDICKVCKYEAKILLHDIKIKSCMTFSDKAKENYLLAVENQQNIQNRPAVIIDHLFIGQIENPTIQSVRLGFKAAHRLECYKASSAVCDFEIKKIDAESELIKAEENKYNFEREVKGEYKFMYKISADYLLEREERIGNLKKDFEFLLLQLQNNPFCRIYKDSKPTGGGYPASDKQAFPLDASIKTIDSLDKRKTLDIQQNENDDDFDDDDFDDDDFDDDDFDDDDFDD